MYHLTRWKEDAPIKLKSLCIKFLDRRLLKAINIEDLNTENQLEALAIARKMTQDNNKDPDLNCGIRHNKFFGYHPYKSGLRIWDGKNLKALEKNSLLIEKLIHPYNSTWLIYPKIINDSLINKIIILRESRRDCGIK